MVVSRLPGVPEKNDITLLHGSGIDVTEIK
jgi:hypothetical protein